MLAGGGGGGGGGVTLVGGVEVDPPPPQPASKAAAPPPASNFKRSRAVNIRIINSLMIVVILMTTLSFYLRSADVTVNAIKEKTTHSPECVVFSLR